MTDTFVSQITNHATYRGNSPTTGAVAAEDGIGELAKWFDVFLDKLKDVIRSVSTATHLVGGVS